MTESGGDDTILNVRIPSSLASRVEEASEKRGFKNKSEFVRTALRDAIDPPQELTDQTLQDIQDSQKMAEEQETTSLGDYISESNTPSAGDSKKAPISKISEGSSLGELQNLFSSETTVDRTDLDILAIGCGGAGNNIIHRLSDIGAKNIRTLALNTDREHLKKIEADTKLLIGKSLTSGLGAGGDPDLGAQAAKKAEDPILEVISDADIVFVIGGLGGGTGTGAAPIVAEMASGAGALSIGLVSTPFNVEVERLSKAREGIDTLRSKCDTVMVFDNNLLLDYMPNLPLSKAFSVMDQIIAESMQNLVGTFAKNALVDIDFADFSSVVRDGDIGSILVGESDIQNLDTVVSDTLQHPLINADISTASAGIVQITGPENLTIEEAEGIVELLINHMSSDASLVWGARKSSKLTETIRVMVFLTGIEYQTEAVVDRGSKIESSEGVELLSSGLQDNPDRRQSPIGL